MSHLQPPRIVHDASQSQSQRRVPGSRRHSDASSVFDAHIGGVPISAVAESRRSPAAPSPDVMEGNKSSNNDSTGFIVISGGTGCNAIVSAFGPNVTYAMPVSDNGGSSSEV